MYGYTLTSNGYEETLPNDRHTALYDFARHIERRGLPTEGRCYSLTHYWTPAPHSPIAGKQMKRTILVCDENGLFDYDGSGAPATVAHGPIHRPLRGKGLT
jgi:hypothetical protein